MFGVSDLGSAARAAGSPQIAAPLDPSGFSCGSGVTGCAGGSGADAALTAQPLRRRNMTPVLRLTLRRASLSGEFTQAQRQEARHFLERATPAQWAEFENAANDMTPTDPEIEQLVMAEALAPAAGGNQRLLAKLLGWAWEHRQELLQFVTLILQAVPK